MQFIIYLFIFFLNIDTVSRLQACTFQESRNLKGETVYSQKKTKTKTKPKTKTKTKKPPLIFVFVCQLLLDLHLRKLAN